MTGACLHKKGVSFHWFLQNTAATAIYKVSLESWSPFFSTRVCKVSVVEVCKSSLGLPWKRLETCSVSVSVLLRNLGLICEKVTVQQSCMHTTCHGVNCAAVTPLQVGFILR